MAWHSKKENSFPMPTGLPPARIADHERYFGRLSIMLSFFPLFVPKKVREGGGLTSQSSRRCGSWPMAYVGHRRNPIATQVCKQSN